MNIGALALTISRFDTAIPPHKGEATGTEWSGTWGSFVQSLQPRRTGEKDGLCFAPARFKKKPDGVHIGRKKTALISRTAIALDIETNGKTGEIPPAPAQVVARLVRMGIAAVVYSSHRHHPENDTRFRVIIPLSDEIAPEIPASEVMAEHLGLGGVLDRGKLGAASLFYLPSCALGAQHLHFFEAIYGMPVSADGITDTGLALLHNRKAEADRIAAEAQYAAAERRAEKMAAGFDPDDSLIEKIRAHLDLEQILLNHGYTQSGRKFRHPNSSSGQYGADIKTLGGVDRVFSHNATDPLHESNLPAWCGKVTALDAFDVLAILEFGGDRKGALNKLAERFGLAKTAEKKELSALLFRLIRQQASQEEIERAAFAEGVRLGLSREDVCRAAIWVRKQSVENRRAA